MREAALLGVLVVGTACGRAPEQGVAANPMPAAPVASTAQPASSPAPSATPMRRIAQAETAVASDATRPTLAIYAMSRGKGVPDETRAALTRIRELLDAARKDGRVAAMKSSRIGIEGETRLCVAFRDASAAAELGAQVRATAEGVELLNVVAEPCRSEEKKP